MTPAVKRLWLAVVIIVSSLIASASVIVYYMFFEPPWLQYANPELKTAVDQVVAGDVIPVFVQRTSTDSRLRVYSIARQLHCDTFKRPAVMEPTVAEVRPGENAGTSYVNRIPERVTLDDYGPPVPMPTGICWIEGAVELQGKIRTIPISWHTTRFKVLSKADAAAMVTR